MCSELANYAGHNDVWEENTQMGGKTAEPKNCRV